MIKTLAHSLLLFGVALWCVATVLDALPSPHHITLRNLTLVLCCVPYGIACLFGPRRRP